jgi:hypothetical protein
MILYDLKCAKGHLFEGWFRDSAAFDKQRKGRKVLCPDCGTARVEKALMAPRLNKGGKGIDAAPAAKAPEQAEKLRAFLGEVREQIEKNCDYVGPQFAEEARKIHYGETGERNIYGEATADDAKALKEEGVEFGTVPWLPRRDS